MKRFLNFDVSIINFIGKELNFSTFVICFFVVNQSICKETSTEIFVN